MYNAYNEKTTDENLLREYKKYLDNGQITEKESRLWKFVLSNYGTDEFSTKMLEKDFQNAAYATIRGFVQKFERLGLLSSTKYGTRKKNHIIRAVITVIHFKLFEIFVIDTFKQ